MKLINNYILEKLHLDKELKLPIDLLNQVFNNINELADALNNYFNDKLEKPAKVIKSEVIFKVTNQGFPRRNNINGTGTTVQDHFILKLKKDNGGYGYDIRFGLINNKELVMQSMYNIPTYPGKKMLECDHLILGYTFGKDNFLNWLIILKNEKILSSDLIKIFNILNDEKDK